MKKILFIKLLFIGLLFLSIHSQAQPMTLTHSNSQVVLASNSSGCFSVAGHSANSYFRVFKISDFVAASSFAVSEVHFGVDESYSPSGNQPISIRLYTLNGTTLNYSNLTLINSLTGTINNMNQTIAYAPITAIVPGTGTLVVEIHTPNGQFNNNFFFIGSNTSGQTSPSYIQASDCNINNITDISNLSLNNPMHIVMNVVGEAHVDRPDPFTDSSANVCAGSTGITYTVPGIAGLTYNWSYSGSGATINRSGNSVTIDFAPGATSGTLSVTASNGTITSPARTIAVTVNPSIQASLNRSENVLSINGNFSTYSWFYNNTLIAGATSREYTINANGSYFAKVTNADGCNTNTDTLNITDYKETSIDQLSKEYAISIFPNPAGNIVNISSSKEVNVILHSIDGREILAKEKAESIDVSHLDNGVYYLTFTNNKGDLVVRKRLVKTDK